MPSSHTDPCPGCGQPVACTSFPGGNNCGTNVCDRCSGAEREARKAQRRREMEHRAPAAVAADDGLHVGDMWRPRDTATWGDLVRISNLDDVEHPKLVTIQTSRGEEPTIDVADLRREFAFAAPAGSDPKEVLAQTKTKPVRGKVRPGPHAQERLAQADAPRESAGDSARNVVRGIVAASVVDSASPARRLPIALIDSSPLNPRKRFDEDELQRLADSLKADGLLQPIVVKPVGGRYEIIAGERRWRAAKQLGWTDIDAIVRADVDDATHLRLALLENLERTDLDPLEEAEGYRQLQQLGMTQAAIAEAVHRSQPSIANSIRLLRAPDQVRERLAKREMSPSHVLALLSRFENFPEALVKVAEVAVERRTPSKELEKPLGWEFTQALREANLAVEVSGAEFDWRKTCTSCPFGAFVGSSYGGQCLKPEHFRQLQKEQWAKDKTKLEKAAEKSAAGEKVTLKLSQLKYGQYEQIYTAPEGCSTACACRAKALTHGNTTVDVCLKPAELHRLRQAQRDREAAARRAHAEDLGKRCGDRLDQVTSIGSDELALLAGAAIDDVRDDGVVTRILTKYAPGFKLSGKAGYDDLASLQPLQLVKIAVELLLSSEISELMRWDSSPTEFAAWYAGAADKREGKRTKTASEGDATEIVPAQAERRAEGAELALAGGVVS